MIELPFHLILFKILIKIDTKSIHRFKLVSKQWLDGLSSPEFVFKRGCYVEDYLVMFIVLYYLQYNTISLFITSSVLMELWPRELIELYGLHDQQGSQENLNVTEEMVVIENGQRTIYQVYDDDN
ncbi:putative F-box domain-containing protein [Helianthus anomalus]